MRKAVTRLNDCTLLNASFDDHIQRRRQALVQKKEILNSRTYMATYIGKSDQPMLVLFRTETSRTLVNHYELDKKSFWKIIMFHSENHKICANSEVDRTLTKDFTNVNYKIALDADPTRNQDVHNHLVQYFPRDNGLPNFFIKLREAFQRR